MTVQIPWKSVNERWFLYKGIPDEDCRDQKSIKKSPLTNELNIASKKNWNGVMFGALLIWLRDVGIKKIRAEIFGKLQNSMLMENIKYKMTEKINHQTFLDMQERR